MLYTLYSKLNLENEFLHTVLDFKNIKNLYFKIIQYLKNKIPIV